MSGAAEKPAGKMTVAEFLVWDDGTDTRYELIDGVPVPKHGAWREGTFAMSPPSPRHSSIEYRVIRALARQLRATCEALPNAGVARDVGEATYREPDVLVRCGQPVAGEFVVDARVVIEVLSRTTKSSDLFDKLFFYQSLPTVSDIVYLWQERRRAMHYRRGVDGAWFVSNVIGDGAVVLSADVGEAGASVTLSLNELYEGLFDEEAVE